LHINAKFAPINTKGGGENLIYIFGFYVLSVTHAPQFYFFTSNKGSNNELISKPIVKFHAEVGSPTERPYTKNQLLFWTGNTRNGMLKCRSSLSASAQW